jgi:hypothetical protein
MSVAPVAILGMHRSGTSCLAGSLEEAGLFLGEVNTAAPFNKRGNRENRAIMDLHDAVLAHNGGAWDRAPASVQWLPDHRTRLAEIIGSYPAGLLWGFKEPRSLLVLEGWIDALPELRFVGTFRHPAAVQASLAHRNHFEPARSYDIWLAYNRRLIDWQHRFGFPLVSFDWPNPRYLKALETLAQSLGLTSPTGGFQFFTNELRSNAARGDEDLPAEVRKVYETLLDIAE